MDGLAGLYNRRYFETAFEVAWQNAVRNRERLALLTGVRSGMARNRVVAGTL
jgi:GGDEF domain-containing protein